MVAIARAASPAGNRIKEFISHNKELIIIIVLSSILIFPFVFDSFFNGESFRYAEGVQRIKEHGVKAFPDIFNGEMSFGYYLVIYLLSSGLNSAWELSTIMNYLNALSSIAMVCFLFIFVSSITKLINLALFTCIAVLFAPAIWLLSLYGHPSLLSLTFFIGAICLLTNIDLANLSTRSEALKGLLFILFSYIALAIRLDIILSFGAYFGILYFHRNLSISNAAKLFIGILIVFTMLLISRYYLLGFIINPTGGTFAYHMATRLNLNIVYLSKLIIKHLFLWAFGVNLLISALALWGIIHFGVKSRMVVLFFSWVIPYFGFIPFFGMDITRLMAPTVPVIALVAVSFLAQKFAPFRQGTIFMALVLIVTQLVSIGLYYPVEAAYQIRTKVENRSLANVIIGFPITDHNYHQRQIWGRNYATSQVANERKASVLIIDFLDYGLFYEYFIKNNHDVISSTRIMVRNIPINKIITKENIFYILDIGYCTWEQSPISLILNHPDITIDKIHVTPFSSEFPVDKNKKYLERNEITSLLAREKSIMGTRRKIISK